MRKLPIALLFAAATASAQIPVDVEIGWRWIELEGNQAMYRTQIDEQSGLLIRALTYSTPDFRVDVSDLGVGPASAVRLEAGRGELFRLRASYRTADQFSAVPSFAQHTYDRQRDMVDVDLELLPGRKITPFLGYSTNRIHGPGTTTYHFGQDEFLFGTDLSDHDRELRGGVAFNTGRVYGVVTQGWRRFETREVMTLAAGAGAGNITDPVLGRQITAGGISRESKFSGSTPFTNLSVTADLTKRLRLTGNYVRFSADADGDEIESSTGSFASFEISRFFNGTFETVSSRARNETWRGGARGELTIVDGVDLYAGVQHEERDLSGTALINTLFKQSITFGGADPRDLALALDTESSIERQEKQGHIGVNVRKLGPFSIRAEIRTDDVIADVDESLEEIVVRGSQEGRFRRRVDTFDGTVSYSRNALTLGGAWRHDSADQPIFRTDYDERDRYRLRAQWSSPKDFVRGGVTAEQTDQSGLLTGRMRQLTADAEVAPVEKLHLRGSYSRFRSNSEAAIRLPQNFSLDQSIHAERGRAIEGGFALFLMPFTLDAGTSRFRNEGTLPFDVLRYRVRATFDFKAHAGVAAEFTKDKYFETLTSASNFDAKRYGLFLRWRP